MTRLFPLAGLPASQVQLPIMDFREATKRYAAVGRPADIAEQIRAYLKAGARDIGVDLVCRRSERSAQLEQYAREVIPLLRPGI